MGKINNDTVELHKKYITYYDKRINICKHLFYIVPNIFLLLSYLFYNDLVSMIGSGLSLTVFIVLFISTMLTIFLYWRRFRIFKTYNEYINQGFDEINKKHEEEIKDMFR